MQKYFDFSLFFFFFFRNIPDSEYKLRFYSLQVLQSALNSKKIILYSSFFLMLLKLKYFIVSIMIVLKKIFESRYSEVI